MSYEVIKRVSPIKQCSMTGSTKAHGPAANSLLDLLHAA